MTRKKLVIILGSYFILNLPLFCLQQQEALPFPITAFQLENGLQVVLSEDFSIPVVSVAVAYLVGSIDDKEGKTGLAYLLGNLVFQGSQNIRKLQHLNFIHRVGGKIYIRTGIDKTTLSQTVSSNHLPTVLWLESDRMTSLNITDENVQEAKSAIIEEINNQKYADPYLENAIRFDELLFGKYSYSHPVHGKEADLREITVEDVNEFYTTYYIPSNAVLCITGNINKQRTVELVKKYFQTIPKGKKAPISQANQSQETNEITETLKNPLATSPGFFLGYRIAPPGSPDYYPLVLVDYILLRAKGSRFYKRLQRRERLVTYMEGGIQRRKDQTVFRIFVMNSNEYTKDMSQKGLFSEINRLKSIPISEKELERAKNMLRRDYIQRYSTSLDKAIFLAESFLDGTTPEELSTELIKYLNVSPHRINGIMNRYFNQYSVLLNIDIK